MEFQGKRVLITGSTRGIGRALAERMLDEGAVVAINGRNPGAVSQTVSELTSRGSAVPAPADLTQRGGCDAAVNAAVTGLGGLDILVNNAGVLHIGTIEETDEDTWDWVVDTNVKSVHLCTRAALPALRESGGVVVNHASIAGLLGFSKISAYCASKTAIVGLTRSMAMELAPDIRVNCVCPTTVDNEMGSQGFQLSHDPAAARADFIASNTMKRMPTNEDVVEAICFLASDRSAFMTGVAMPVDGGRSAGG